METADVVVVGGGCIGTSTAMHLAERGIGRIVLIERNALASASTGKSSAILRQHYTTEVMARLVHESVNVFRHFDEVVGGTSGYVQTGYLNVVDEADRAAVEHNVLLQQSVGINTRVVYPEELRDLVPGMYTDDLAAAAYEPDTGYADPHLTTLAFAERARQLGVDIRQHTAVRHVWIEHGQVRGVRTTKGDIETRSIVLAAGVWGARLAAELDWGLPVVPTRHRICIFRRPPSFGPHPVVGDRVSLGYFRPERDLTLVGSLDAVDNEDIVDPDAYNEKVTLGEAEIAGRRLAHRFPAAVDAAFTSGYAGIYDITPDLHAILDQCPDLEGLFCALGFSGHGFKLSPVMGRLVADLVTQPDRRAPELAFFAADRFGRGQSIRGEWFYQRVPNYQ